jgi:hypothetical protein
MTRQYPPRSQAQSQKARLPGLPCLFREDVVQEVLVLPWELWNL